MQYTGKEQIFSGVPLKLDEASASTTLGAKMYDGDREFTYVLAGGTLVVGNLLQSPAEDTGDQGLAVAVAAIGSLTITTTSTVTVTANQYAGGTVLVTVTPGLGQLFRIKGHPAATSAAVVLTLEEPIDVALTTASRIDLVKNIYGGVIQNPTGASGVVVGVAVNAITSGQYGWIQTGGVAPVLNEGGVTVGTTVVASNGTAGAVEAGIDATDAQAIVGTAVTGGATTEVSAIKLSIH